FALGQGPSGSSDPFALRRAAIGIINMLAAGLPIQLLPSVRASLETFDFLDFDREAVLAEILGFFVTRTKVKLRDDGVSADVVDAVLAAGIVEPLQIITRSRALLKAREDMPELMEDLAVAYARANNLRVESLGCTIDGSLLGVAETRLQSSLVAFSAQVEAFLAEDDFASCLEVLAALREPIDRFFEEVLIMDHDEAIRENRLRLLNSFVAVFSPLADFSKLARPGR
ncbi:MAG: glycine--tRNA ligase subunit beta, partial [Eggerthellaceae bacterium]|nr:glycine--tRNA ligase subunit beta [Eggerthellaceae bacterium]